MAVKLRLMRLGRRHRPFFRINAIDSRAPRDGRIIEKLGHYDPIEKDTEKQIVLNRERIQYWLDNGAIPSDAVSQILLRHGIKHKYAEEKAARRARAKGFARAKGKPFTEAERVALRKEAEAAEKERRAKRQLWLNFDTEPELKQKSQECSKELPPRAENDTQRSFIAQLQQREKCSFAGGLMHHLFLQEMGFEKIIAPLPLNP